MYNHYKHTKFVHYFNTTGIIQHNDIVSYLVYLILLNCYNSPPQGPQYHLTDVGHVKVASHTLNFGWELGPTGLEIQHGKGSTLLTYENKNTDGQSLRYSILE